MSRTVRMKEKEVRVLLHQAAKLRDSLTQEQERLLGREPDYGGNTTIAVYDPNRLLEAFPSLRLRPGFKLASYQYLSGGNGSGFTFAIPADRHLPTPPPMNSNHNRWPWASPEDPVYDQAQALLEWASPEVNRFLIGDDSPRSFFEASILDREVYELGAIWHGCSWAVQRVLTGREGIPGTDWVSELDDPDCPDPPDAWEAPYASLASLDQLRWGTLTHVFEAARSFLDPVLAGSLDSAWDPNTWTWAETTPTAPA